MRPINGEGTGWEEERPFSLAQVDVKDVLNKGTLGTELWDHPAKRKLSRYGWTFLEGRTRLRFLAWSHEVSLTNGLCFVVLVMLWLRGRDRGGRWPGRPAGRSSGGVTPRSSTGSRRSTTLRWGRGFRGSLWGGRNRSGRVERSHRTDDEEFYIPFLGKVQTEDGFLRKAVGWVYYHNLERPHFGKGMDGNPPFRKLRGLGYDLPEEFALFPPLVLDQISADWALWWSSRGGNDLLAHYTPP